MFSTVFTAAPAVFAAFVLFGAMFVPSTGSGKKRVCETVDSFGELS